MTRVSLFAILALCIVFSASAQHSGDSQGGLLYEPWPSAAADATWRFQPACELCIPAAGDFTSLAEVREYSPGEFAFVSRGPDTWWETTGDVTNNFAVANRWHNYVLGNDMFTRGNNLKCTFTFWGDPTDPAWNPDAFGPNGPIAWPAHSGVLGPFHRSSGMDHMTAINSNLEAGLETNITGFDNWKFQTSGMWNTAIFDDEHGTFGNFANNQPFLDALQGATDEMTAVVLEVVLGNTDGAALSYGPAAKGPALIEIFDNRDIASDPGAQNDVWIGFASDLGALLVDNIIVEDDNNIFVPGPVGPPAPPVTVQIFDHDFPGAAGGDPDPNFWQVFDSDSGPTANSDGQIQLGGSLFMDNDPEGTTQNCWSHAISTDGGSMLDAFARQDGMGNALRVTWEYADLTNNFVYLALTAPGDIIKTDVDGASSGFHINTNGLSAFVRNDNDAVRPEDPLNNGSFADPMANGFPASGDLMTGKVRITCGFNNGGMIEVAPGATKGPSGPLFEENWDAAGAAGMVDAGIWNLDQGLNPTDDMYILEDIDGAGDYAMRCWNSQGDEDDAVCGCNWTGHLYSQATYDRGDNIRCTFCFWGDPAANNWPTPNGATSGSAMDDSEGFGLEAPWHDSVRDNAPWQSCEACTLMWYNWDKAGNGPLWAHAGRWGNNDFDASANFKTAIESAMPNKANALYVRITLGNTQGALYEYSTDGGMTWIEEVDQRDGMDVDAPMTATDLMLGFIHIFRTHVFLDNIVVEDDNNVAPPPGPGPDNWELVFDWRDNGTGDASNGYHISMIGPCGSDVTINRVFTEYISGAVPPTSVVKWESYE